MKITAILFAFTFSSPPVRTLANVSLTVADRCEIQRNWKLNSNSESRYRKVVCKKSVTCVGDDFTNCKNCTENYAMFCADIDRYLWKKFTCTPHTISCALYPLEVRLRVWGSVQQKTRKRLTWRTLEIGWEQRLRKYTCSNREFSWISKRMIDIYESAQCNRFTSRHCLLRLPKSHVAA